jgi:hypothetical protein
MTSRAALWLEFWAGPVVWFVSLCATFALAPWACSQRRQAMLIIVPLAALLVTAALARKAWVQWHAVGRETPGELGGEVAATRALASGSVWVNATFFVVILAQLIVSVVMGACE